MIHVEQTQICTLQKWNVINSLSSGVFFIVRYLQIKTSLCIRFFDQCDAEELISDVP